MRTPALMYHDVVAPEAPDASGFPGGAAASYKLGRAEFAAHLDALAAAGLRSGRCDVAEAGDVLLTFDDGGASAPHIAAELERRGMLGHFFITTTRIDTPGFVSRDELRALAAAGHIVGSHSHTHPVEISRLDDAALAAEWANSMATLREILGHPIEVASVPGGFLSRRVAAAAAAAGVRQLFTSEPVAGASQGPGCMLLGRYTLWRGMPAEVAVALARGQGTARLRQWLGWNLKKPLKRWARPLYHWVRARRLAERG